MPYFPGPKDGFDEKQKSWITTYVGLSEDQLASVVEGQRALRLKIEEINVAIEQLAERLDKNGK